MTVFGNHFKRKSCLLLHTIRMVSLLLLLACLSVTQVTGLASSADQPDATAKAKEFSTPEDAVRHFYEALTLNDFEMAMEAFAIREHAEGIDFPGFVDRMKMHTPITNLAPSTNDLYRSLNSASVLGSFANQMKMMIYSFFVTEGLDGKPLSPADRSYAEAFEVAVDAQKLVNLKLIRIDPPMKAILESARNIENFAMLAKLYRAEEMTERIVLYELDGQTFLGGFGLYRYAFGWKICRLYSSLAGTSATGTTEPVTLQAYIGIL